MPSLNKLDPIRSLMYELDSNLNKIRDTKEYSTYRGMINRINSSQAYGHLSISPEFLEPRGLERFIEEVGFAPSPYHTLDRIDNSKGYLIGNIRWATTSENSRNRDWAYRVKQQDGALISLWDYCEANNLHTMRIRQYMRYRKMKIISVDDISKIMMHEPVQWRIM